MTAKKLRITIIGAGRYGKELIAPKYQQNPDCILVAIIDPSRKPSDFAQSDLEHVPLFKSLAEWKNKYGAPTPLDVFDLCIHPDQLPTVVAELGKMGAQKIILPKPIAVLEKAWQQLEGEVVKHQMTALVSSQWAYSELTRVLAEHVATLTPKNIRRIKMEFSQTFDATRLQHYTPVTALLPHMVQILESMGFNHATYRVDLRVSTPTRLEVNLVDPSKKGPSIELVTDLLAPNPVRKVWVWGTHDSPVLVADYWVQYEGARIVRGLCLDAFGEHYTFTEDTLARMVERHVAFFTGSTPQGVLTLEHYLPIQRRILEIADQIARTSNRPNH